MRGPDTFTESLFSLKRLEDLFDGMYEDASKAGRPNIAPQKLMRAMVLQVLHSVRLERLLMEQAQYNLLFRWFIGLSMDDNVCMPTVFSKNRKRLIKHDAVVAFFNEVLAQAERKNWLSKERSSVDGTLIQAWAGHKSFVPKDGGDAGTGQGKEASTSVTPKGETGFRDQTRSNDTHASKTDPDSRLYREGNTASELRLMGYTLMGNRNRLIVNAKITQPDGCVERETAISIIMDVRYVNPDTITLAADKGYYAAEFIAELERLQVKPHVAQNKSGHRSAVTDDIAQTPGYSQSMQSRKLIEQGFGWAKSIGQVRQVMVRGLKRVEQLFVLNMTTYNIVRMRSLGQVRLQGAL